MLAYRFALEFPSFVTHLLTFAVPYLAATGTFNPLDDFVKLIPTIAYQVQFGSEEGFIESHTKDKSGIRNYLNAMYFGRSADGQIAMTPVEGYNAELAPALERSELVSEDELKYYVGEYARKGLRGPCKSTRWSIYDQSTMHHVYCANYSNRQLLPHPSREFRSR